MVFHDEIELEDFEWDEESESWTYPCPCGDRFMITVDARDPRFDAKGTSLLLRDAGGTRVTLLEI